MASARQYHQAHAAHTLLPARFLRPSLFHSCTSQTSPTASPPLPYASDRADLRRQLKRRRRALSDCARRYASLRMARRIMRHPALLGAKRVALYLPSLEEIDPTYLLGMLRTRGVNAYVPVLRPGQQHRLWFVALTPDTPLVHNRYGLLEPAPRHAANRRHRCPVSALDVLLMPLLGFDHEGGRLGMGGGYYDRTLAFTRYSTRPAPALIGVAYECQRVTSLPLADWDIPLDAIITEMACYDNARTAHRERPGAGLNPG